MRRREMAAGVGIQHPPRGVGWGGCWGHLGAALQSESSDPRMRLDAGRSRPWPGLIVL